MSGWAFEDLPVSGQSVEDLSQPGFVVGQGLVKELLPRTIQGNGVVTGFPDVQTDEYVYVLLIQNHRHTRSLVRASLSCVGWSTAAGVGIHVTKDPSSCLYQRSAAAKPVPVTTPPGS